MKSDNFSKRARSDAFNFLDLFAGCGGFSLGLESAGLNGLGTVEIDLPTRRTLETNFGASPLEAIRKSNGDILKIDPVELKRNIRSLGVKDLDLLVACPPCQGFSRIGRGKLDSLRGKRGSFNSDRRNYLYKRAIVFLRTLKPKAFLFENVPGMIFMGGRNIAERVCIDAEESGYVVRCAILNAAWYGAPQLRERVIILGYRKDLKTVPDFPEITNFGKWLDGHMSVSDTPLEYWSRKDFFVQFSKLRKNGKLKPLTSVGEALADLPRFTTHLKALNRGSRYKSLRSEFAPRPYTTETPPNAYCDLMRRWGPFKSEGVVDHFCRWTPRDFETFARMRSGDRYNEACEIAEERYHEAVRSFKRGRRKRPLKSEFIPPYRRDSFEEKWRKLYRDRPSWTLTAHLSQDTYSHIHFDSRQARGLTIREAARLQSFPDGFKVEGNTGDAFRQIGNAVPPLLARCLGIRIRQQLAQIEKTVVRRKAKKFFLPLSVTGPDSTVPGRLS